MLPIEINNALNEISYELKDSLCAYTIRSSKKITKRIVRGVVIGFIFSQFSPVLVSTALFGVTFGLLALSERIVLRQRMVSSRRFNEDYLILSLGLLFLATVTLIKYTGTGTICCTALLAFSMLAFVFSKLYILRIDAKQNWKWLNIATESHDQSSYYKYRLRRIFVASLLSVYACRP